MGIFKRVGDYAKSVGNDLTSGNKSVYEAVTKKKNPKWADKAYNDKQFDSLAERWSKKRSR